MKVKSFLLAIMFALMPVLWAQRAPAQAAASDPGRGKLRAERRQDMIELHKQEMEAMKADVEKVKSSLAQMKANLLTIKDRNEMDRWRNNVDMWEAMVGHMDRMLKHMESLGPGMMGPGMVGPPPMSSTGIVPQLLGIGEGWGGKGIGTVLSQPGSTKQNARFLRCATKT